MTADSPIDLSSAIASIQVTIALLNALEPDGKWHKIPLLDGWGSFPYGLQPAAIKALDEALQAERTAALNRYLQRKLAGNRKDSKRVQMELPGVRYEWTSK